MTRAQHAGFPEDDEPSWAFLAAGTTTPGIRRILEAAATDWPKVRLDPVRFPLWGRKLLSDLQTASVTSEESGFPVPLANPACACVVGLAVRRASFSLEELPHADRWLRWALSNRNAAVARLALGRGACPHDPNADPANSCFYRALEHPERQGMLLLSEWEEAGVVLSDPDVWRGAMIRLCRSDAHLPPGNTGRPEDLVSRGALFAETTELMGQLLEKGTDPIWFDRDDDDLGADFLAWYARCGDLEYLQDERVVGVAKTAGLIQRVQALPENRTAPRPRF